MRIRLVCDVNYAHWFTGALCASYYNRPATIQWFEPTPEAPNTYTWVVEAAPFA